MLQIIIFFAGLIKTSNLLEPRFGHLNMLAEAAALLPYEDIIDQENGKTKDDIFMNESPRNSLYDELKLKKRKLFLFPSADSTKDFKNKKVRNDDISKNTSKLDENTKNVD